MNLYTRSHYPTTTPNTTFPSKSIIILLLIITIINQVGAYVHPITIHGHFFVDSITKEPFYIKGIDYQPGGSSAVSNHKDPLSDPKKCARDIILFQELGINTIRIYSVNSNLDHDICMTMLASAGIYLVLDVNSPLPNHHLNRYEPWTTYNLFYLENVFKIVEQFSHYNNTLGFIAGNEIVNDPTSASVSPVYIKAMIRDIKTYIQINSPRQIPVGYSAADDLNYRMSLAKYLECSNDNPNESVDFYGVNSYQWCGEQTFYSSGYNILVDDYREFTKPIFFSEYGCNEVLPRNFDEVPILYTNDMIDVFSGGLVYEFTQEPNNYGLVEILSNGDVKLLRDFVQLKKQFDNLPDLDYSFVVNSMKSNAKQIQNKLKQYKSSIPRCELSYTNLDVSLGLPNSLAENLIETGVRVKHGSFIDLKQLDLESKYNIYQVNGEKYPTYNSIDILIDIDDPEHLPKEQHDHWENPGKGHSSTIIPTSTPTTSTITGHKKAKHTQIIVGSSTYPEDISYPSEENTPPPGGIDVGGDYENKPIYDEVDADDDRVSNGFMAVVQKVANSFKKLYSSLFN